MNDVIDGCQFHSVGRESKFRTSKLNSRLIKECFLLLSHQFNTAIPLEIPVENVLSRLLKTASGKTISQNSNVL